MKTHPTPTPRAVLPAPGKCDLAAAAAVDGRDNVIVVRADPQGTGVPGPLREDPSIEPGRAALTGPLVFGRICS